MIDMLIFMPTDVTPVIRNKLNEFNLCLFTLIDFSSISAKVVILQFCSIKYAPELENFLNYDCLKTTLFINNNLYF